MQIAIDLDGVAWKHREFFKELCWGLKSRGHKIGIITAHSKYDRQVDTDLFVARGFPYPDFYFGMSNEDKLIGVFKRRIMDENKIDVIIDDFGGNNKDIEDSFFNDTVIDFILLKVYPGED